MNLPRKVEINLTLTIFIFWVRLAGQLDIKLGCLITTSSF